MSDNKVSLLKGDKVSLDKLAADAGIEKIDLLSLGLGWNPQDSSGSEFDLDASVFMVDAAGKTQKGKFVYFRNLKSDDGSVTHSGDNRTGVGAGDDETITIELTKVSPEIQKLIVVVNIYDAVARKQTFGQVNDSVVRLYDKDKKELLKYELNEDYSRDTGITVCSIYRRGDSWSFSAEGKGQVEGLDAMCRLYGLELE
jgi:tellurium resistance protein TerD